MTDVLDEYYKNITKEFEARLVEYFTTTYPGQDVRSLKFQHEVLLDCRMKTFPGGGREYWDGEKLILTVKPYLTENSTGFTITENWKIPENGISKTKEVKHG